MTERSPDAGIAQPEDSGPAPTAADVVRGERGLASVNRMRSFQSRVSSVMACGLMILLGVGMLTWYYTNALSRQGRARRSAQTAAATRAEGDAPLPALGRIEPLSLAVAAQSHSASDTPSCGRDALDRTGRPTDESASMDAHQPLQPPALPLGQAAPSWGAGTYIAPGSVAPGSYGVVSPKTAAQLALERKLAGATFARETAAGLGPSGFPGSTATAGSNVVAGSSGAPATTGTMAALLQPTVIPSVRAQVLPTQRFLLAKGTFIDCTLETAIDSTLPGMTTCITATDTFGLDGEVVLLERGTKLIGETRGQVQQGTARIFVLWTEARTPAGVVVPLDSPGADELGRAGLSGEVNRHFWDRFGAAILVSTLDGAVQAAVQSSSRGTGAVIYDPATSEGVMTDVLKGTVNIPPTVTKRNGDRIQVFVARDLDFRPVYELRRAHAGR